MDTDFINGIHQLHDSKEVEHLFGLFFSEQHACWWQDSVHCSKIKRLLLIFLIPGYKQEGFKATLEKHFSHCFECVQGYHIEKNNLSESFKELKPTEYQTLLRYINEWDKYRLERTLNFLLEQTKLSSNITNNIDNNNLKLFSITIYEILQSSSLSLNNFSKLIELNFRQFLHIEPSYELDLDFNQFLSLLSHPLTQVNQLTVDIIHYWPSPLSLKIADTIINSLFISLGQIQTKLSKLSQEPGISLKVIWDCLYFSLRLFPSNFFEGTKSSRLLPIFNSLLKSFECDRVYDYSRSRCFTQLLLHLKGNCWSSSASINAAAPVEFIRLILVSFMELFTSTTSLEGWTIYFQGLRGLVEYFIRTFENLPLYSTLVEKIIGLIFNILQHSNCRPEFQQTLSEFGLELTIHGYTVCKPLPVQAFLLNHSPLLSFAIGDEVSQKNAQPLFKFAFQDDFKLIQTYSTNPKLYFTRTRELHLPLWEFFLNNSQVLSNPSYVELIFQAFQEVTYSLRESLTVPDDISSASASVLPPKTFGSLISHLDSLFLRFFKNLSFVKDKLDLKQFIITNEPRELVLSFFLTPVSSIRLEIVKLLSIGDLDELTFLPFVVNKVKKLGKVGLPILERSLETFNSTLLKDSSQYTSILFHFTLLKSLHQCLISDTIPQPDGIDFLLPGPNFSTRLRKSIWDLTSLIIIRSRGISDDIMSLDSSRVLVTALELSYLNFKLISINSNSGLNHEEFNLFSQTLLLIDTKLGSLHNLVIPDFLLIISKWVEEAFYYQSQLESGCKRKLFSLVTELLKLPSTSLIDVFKCHLSFITGIPQDKLHDSFDPIKSLPSISTVNLASSYSSVRPSSGSIIPSNFKSLIENNLGVNLPTVSVKSERSPEVPFYSPVSTVTTKEFISSSTLDLAPPSPFPSHRDFSHGPVSEIGLMTKDSPRTNENTINTSRCTDEATILENSVTEFHDAIDLTRDSALMSKETPGMNSSTTDDSFGDIEDLTKDLLDIKPCTEPSRSTVLNLVPQTVIRDSTRDDQSYSNTTTVEDNYDIIKSDPDDSLEDITFKTPPNSPVLYPVHTTDIIEHRGSVPNTTDDSLLMKNESPYLSPSAATEQVNSINEVFNVKPMTIETSHQSFPIPTVKQTPCISTIENIHHGSNTILDKLSVWEAIAGSDKSRLSDKPGDVADIPTKGQDDQSPSKPKTREPQVIERHPQTNPTSSPTVKTVTSRSSKQLASIFTKVYPGKKSTQTNTSTQIHSHPKIKTGQSEALATEALNTTTTEPRHELVSMALPSHHLKRKDSPNPSPRPTKYNHRTPPVVSSSTPQKPRDYPAPKGSDPVLSHSTKKSQPKASANPNLTLSTLPHLDPRIPKVGNLYLARAGNKARQLLKAINVDQRAVKAATYSGESSSDHEEFPKGGLDDLLKESPSIPSPKRNPKSPLLTRPASHDVVKSFAEPIGSNRPKETIMNNSSEFSRSSSDNSDGSSDDSSNSSSDVESSSSHESSPQRGATTAVQKTKLLPPIKPGFTTASTTPRLPKVIKNNGNIISAPRRSKDAPLSHSNRFEKVVLQWSYDALSSYPINTNSDTPCFTSARKIPTTFNSIKEYQDVFEPLFFLECWAQFQRTKDDIFHQDSVLGALNNIHRDASFVELQVNLSKAMPQLTDNDLVLLTLPSDPATITSMGPTTNHPYPVTSDYGEGANHLPPGTRFLGKVICLPGFRDGNDINVRCCFDGMSKSILSLLSPSVSLIVLRLTNLSPLIRDFIALQELVHYPLAEDIILGRASYSLTLDGSVVRRLMLAHQLNKSQAEAIASSLNLSEGISLIQGPPGTGKTKTITGLVSVLLKEFSEFTSLPSRPQKLLICAPSNAAVDEIVKRLMVGLPEGVVNQKLIRVGILDSIHPTIHKQTLDNLVEAEIQSDTTSECFKTKFKLDELDHLISNMRKDLARLVKERVELRATQPYPDGKGDVALDKISFDIGKLEKKLDVQLQLRAASSRSMEANRFAIRNRLLDNAEIICCTLSGAGHDSMKNISCSFDTVIIDEAAQSVELSSLIPLRFGCKRCIMIGDPHQLPPTVLSLTATKFGYNDSLFSRIFNNDKRAAHLLNVQYRMHPAISQLPSALFYNHRLLNAENLEIIKAAPWHASPRFPPFCFYNVAGFEATDRHQSKFNTVECHAAVAIVKDLYTSFPAIDFSGLIAVITPYKSQVSRLKGVFAKQLGPSALTTIDFNTIDGFQGQEKDIIIFSCVRSNISGEVGFLADVRRMNVGLTRAQKSIFVLGNQRALSRNPNWALLLNDARQRGVFYESPPGSHYRAVHSRGNHLV